MTRRSWLRLALLAALFLSLAANAFLVGYVTRTMSTAPGLGGLAERAVRTYPADVRAEFRQLLRDNRPQTRAALQRLREARQELAAAARAEPLDEAEVERAMAGVRQSTDDLLRLMHEFLLEALQRTRRAT